jgi:leucyl/phenylalanyl-tRNA---protein transferase
MGVMTDPRKGAAEGSSTENGSETAPPNFHETLTQRLKRWLLGTAYALRPNRIALLPSLWRLALVHALAPKSQRDMLPALPRFYSERGLVGISDDLSVPSLVANYKRGFFPVCHMGPMKWWCPEERAVIDPAHSHVSRKIQRLLRQHKFTVTMDHDFAGVMEACARPRPGKVPLTWITPRIMRAFWAAYKAGYAHSVEVWDEQGNLVGGVFGVAIGQVYFGESKFSAVRDASKVATAVLHRHLAAWGYKLCDAKWMTPDLASLGFKVMPRDEFRSLLQWYVDEPGHVGRWDIDPTLELADVREKAAEGSTSRESASLKVA